MADKADFDPSGETRAVGTSDPLVGQVFAEYRLSHLIGKGAMGEVYAAEHIRLGRAAAVKLLLPDAARDRKMVQRFFAEAKAVAALQHPSIVDVLDVAETGDRPAMVMELLKGRVLSDVIRSGPLAIDRILAIARQLLGCLAIVHRRGITHRDLKPSNLFLVDDGVHAEALKILDFGIAKFADGNSFGLTSTERGALIGTPHYMSPEQIEGHAIDARTDLYAVGCIVYEMLLGAPPFSAPTMAALLSKHLLERPADVTAARPDVPAPLATLVARCLAKKPADRFASADEALAAISSRSSGPQESGLTRRAKVLLLVGALSTAVILAIAVIVDQTGSRSRKEPSVDDAKTATMHPTAFQDAGLAATGLWVRVTPPDRDVLLGLGVTMKQIPVCPSKATQRGSVDGNGISRFHPYTCQYQLVQGQCVNDLNDCRRVSPKPTSVPTAYYGEASFASLKLHAKLPTGFLPAAGIKAPRAAYEIQANEVTRRELRAFLASPSLRVSPDDTRDLISAPNDDDLPAVGVSWELANLYCVAVFGGRLPSEPEWEFAARGAERRPFAWGDPPIDLHGTRVYAGSDAHLVAVGTSTQDVTPDGIHDLMGNALEWTNDVWRPDDPKEDASWVQRSNGPTYRAVRGLPVEGDLPKEPPREGAAIRRAVCAQHCDKPPTELPWIGFRCARPIRTR
jgi:serine/threonine-protein kinase